jgi:integrase
VDDSSFRAPVGRNRDHAVLEGRLQRRHLDAVPVVGELDGLDKAGAFGCLLEAEKTAHVFRHTWCTRAARAGVSMREIADFVGDDVRTIERVYYSRTPDYLKSAADWRQREARDRTAIQPVENKITLVASNSTAPNTD